MHAQPPPPPAAANARLPGTPHRGPRPSPGAICCAGLVGDRRLGAKPAPFFFSSRRRQMGDTRRGGARCSMRIGGWTRCVCRGTAGVRALMAQRRTSHTARVGRARARRQPAAAATKHSPCDDNQHAVGSLSHPPPTAAQEGAAEQTPIHTLAAAVFLFERARVVSPTREQWRSRGGSSASPIASACALFRELEEPWAQAAGKREQRCRAAPRRRCCCCSAGWS